eukprot:CAMPEP_0183306906 /NCGR_PEP_ID=MMETSP0160_2-20130417/15290_1 /TAXON_ID=2839 ORGANISM="Odontella Sinensis, Strain Grunow 1884" /NCGR_SAMPLE_ID=MMETSP0160_2 /ASSEMBLY_ACC=CAM_ASM_000250 /LENGTH=295 /DNA_ID=CAMNT_0025470385 /DNA_START=212 /DNA_END=1099 /DNA_ORIENTATION=+
MQSGNPSNSGVCFRLPSVQLIGAQKAATSAIADWLFDHGGFFRPLVLANEPDYYSKEVHFFDLDHRYNEGVEFYAKRFRHSSSADSMDATPDTLCCAERVRSTYEAAGGDQATALKIIVILREPVSRELSLYNHLAFDCRHLDPSGLTEWHHQVMRDDGSILSFDEFVSLRSLPALESQKGPGQSTRHGLYVNHLRRWFELFDRRQILVLSYDELRRDPEKLQERIRCFLGRNIPGPFKRANANDSQFKIQSPSCKAKRALRDFFAPLNEELYQILKSKPGPPMEQRPFPRFEDL